MKRFFKWVGIVLGSLVGAFILLIVGVVVYDRLTREDPNKNVVVFRVEPAPGGGPLELVSARKQDGDKTIGWRLYLRNKGATALPAFPLASWDGDIAPAIAWWSATDTNICVPIRQGSSNSSSPKASPPQPRPAASSRARSITSPSRSTTPARQVDLAGPSSYVSTETSL
jgi:hypothetical protein